MSWEIRQGDALERLREMEAESVQTVVTSPPYWGLRDYGDEGQLGLEPTPEQYVANLVEVFREVRRVLRKDGTVWCNLGDSYAGGAGGRGDRDSEIGRLDGSTGRPSQKHDGQRLQRGLAGLKAKDLVGVPWRVAFALQADGWWLRSEIIWAKSNPMPESVTDRPTRAHEQIFLLTKSARYFYDADAIRESVDLEYLSKRWGGSLDRTGENGLGTPERSVATGEAQALGVNPAGRNKRSVWEIATAPYPEAHFATFPPKLVEPCILAGSPPKCCGECGAPWERVVEQPERPEVERSAVRLTPADAEHPTRMVGGVYQRWLDENPPETVGWRSTCAHDDDSGSSVVLDPFAGSGTTGVVALRHDRSFIGLELNPAYCELARNRIRDDAPLLNTQLEAA